ncbi:helix-turn-helix domain-containing protein [Tenuibacillus multivorans]|nr:helix-turn-helix transcriptional regulator [Tenuibacillus multivorans]
MDLGAIIQYYRTKQGLTQKELANGLCSVSYLSKIESGVIEPNLDTIKLLLNRLNMDYEKLTSYDEVAIDHRIDELNQKINDKQLDEAKKIVNELKEVITPFHHSDTQNYFQLNYFYYLISKEPSKRYNIDIQDLLTLEGTFSGRKLYYFYKVIGFYYSCHTNSKLANQYFHKAKEILDSQSIHDPELYYLLALSYMGMRQPVYSNYYCGMALEQFANDLLYNHVTDCYHLLGINYLNLGAYDISENYFNQVLQSKPMGRSPKVRSRATHNLGILHFRKEEYEKALACLHEALENHEKVYDILYSIYVIAKIHYLQGDKDKALKYIKRGEEILKSDNIVKLRYRYYILRHQIHNQTHDEEFLNKAKNVILPYYHTIGENHFIKELNELLAEIYSKKGDYKQASEYYKKLANIMIQ